MWTETDDRPDDGSSAVGTGLGLAIARDIPHVEDNPRDARFVLEVPLHTAS